MKLRLPFIILLFTVFSASAQETKEKEVVKTGWNFGALPATSYSSDLGLMYGGVINLYYYGDGSRYPKYNHSFYFDAVRYTKGSTRFSFKYDSDQLLKGLQTFLELNYDIDQLYSFLGFNGYDAVYNKRWIEQDDPDYKTKAFYAYHRKLFRAKLDVQGPLCGEHLLWIAGFNFQEFEAGPVQVEKLNKKRNEDDKLPDVDGLYAIYKNWGLISDEESNGGNIPAFKAGIIYDTRDFRAVPEHGVWSEAVLEFIPQIFGSETSFTRLSLSHRQYLPLIPKRKLVAAYRLAYQIAIGGNVPFYYLTQMVATSSKGSSFEGVGGEKTLRGILKNRVVGDDVAYSNFELRWRITEFQFKNNNFFIGLNGFVDCGKVTGKRALNFYPTVSETEKSEFIDYGAEDWHSSFGTSLKVGMNENFIVSFDYGHTTDKRDGTARFYMGLNYLF
jgi:hypothetical protein